MCYLLSRNASEDFEDVDKPILIIQKFDEFGLKIFDGGTSSILIEFCPWCGEKLPESKREKWFTEIESLGIDPWSETVSSRYMTDEWFKK